MTFVSYARNYEDVMLWRALKHIDKGFYVDVGAYDPVLYSVTKAFYVRGWRGINIEPEFHWFDKLAADRPEDVNLNIAISDKSGLMRLNDVVDTGLSTFSQVIAEEHKEKGGFAYQEILVPALTLDEVLRTSSSTDIHFLNIDVEGAERQVLAGIDLNRIRPWIILVEATKPLSAEQDYETWDSLLTKRGYAFVYFDGLNRFYLAQEKGELRAAFNAPPNVFDDFIRISELNNLEALNAKEAERQALDVERRTLRAANLRLQAELQAVYSSNSWRITAGLRVLHLGDNIRKVTFALLSLLRVNPLTAAVLTRVHRRFPALWRAVSACLGLAAQGLALSNRGQRLPAAGDLAPRAQRIYSDLRSATAQKK